MIIDSFLGLPPPQTIDIKLERKFETEEPRAVEGSNKSDDSLLDTSDQQIAYNQTGNDIPEDRQIKLDTYDAHGDMIDESTSKNNQGNQPESIDFFA